MYDFPNVVSWVMQMQIRCRNEPKWCPRRYNFWSFSPPKRVFKRYKFGINHDEEIERMATLSFSWNVSWLLWIIVKLAPRVLGSLRSITLLHIYALANCLVSLIARHGTAQVWWASSTSIQVNRFIFYFQPSTRFTILKFLIGIYWYEWCCSIALLSMKIHWMNWMWRMHAALMSDNVLWTFLNEYFSHQWKFLSQRSVHRNE